MIDGKAVAAAVRERVKVDVAAYEQEAGRTPGLATVLVGEDPASHVYVRNKRKACRALGISYHTLQAYLRYSHSLKTSEVHETPPEYS